MRMNWKAAPAVCASLGIAVLGACSDSPVTPAAVKVPGASSLAVGDAATLTPVPGKLIVCKAGNVGGDFTVTRKEGTGDFGSFDSDGMHLEPGECVVAAEAEDGTQNGSTFQVHETGAPNVTFVVTQAVVSWPVPPAPDVTVIDGADVYIDFRFGVRLTYTNTFTSPGPCVVTSNGDAGVGSLREKIADPTCSTITFDLALPATITLMTGELTIDRDVSIEGPGADKLTVARSSAAGTPAFRIVAISAGATTTISGVTITNGSGSVGGGISNLGTLTLSRSAVTGNWATHVGGIANRFGASMTIAHSLVSNNTATFNGGGIENKGTMTLAHSTVSGNTGGQKGGGIANEGGVAGITLVVDHSTIVGNTLSLGGSVGGGIANVSAPVTLVVRSSLIAGNAAEASPDINNGAATTTATYSLIGNPSGHSITSTPENGNLVGTVDTPLDPKVDVLTLNAPGTTATHALLEGSPAVDAGVCTDHEGNVVADDQRGATRPQGATCDMGAYESPWTGTTTTTTVLSLSPSTQQYSDKVSLTASVLPASATGSVQFRKSIDGGTTFADLGSPVTVVNGSAALNDHQILEAAGTPVKFKAVFTATGNFTNSTSDATALTVTRESATIVYASTNVAALQVAAPGGSLAANGLTLTLAVKETSPDLAALTAGLGSIANGGLSVTLAPVGPGSSYALTCTAGTVIGTGYAAMRPFTCKNPGAVAVNVYEVQAIVTGDYYTGTYTDAFTVFDPSLGFATGGGSFVLGGDKVNFGFTMKYGKNGTNLQGNFIAVRHYADGTVSRLKSNALGGLALGEDATVPMGWATFNGKATYTKWDATAGAYVTVGNQSFAVYAEDRDNPGTGIDRIWLGGPGALAMAGTTATAKTNTAVLTGGGIAVPHRAGAKK